MRYYLIAGEASGDLHGANLVREIRKLDADAEIRCWGGDRMEAAGAEVRKHYRELAFMGFWEVVANLRTILANLSYCKQELTEFEADVLVLIDYPGFNLRMARFAKESGMKVCYYISPQLWAWKEKRVEQIRRFTDRILVIFPFEKDWYAEKGIEADFVGHPLLDELAKTGHQTSEAQRDLIALLPGSRKQEISRMLPLFAEVADRFPDERFAIAGLSLHGEAYYKDLIGERNIELRMDQTYALLAASKAAMVTSGTATMETALFDVPQLVAYKGNWISYQLGKRLVKVDYISMVNLILNKPAVREHIQTDCTADELENELRRILEAETSAAIRKDYAALKSALGGPGASARAAALVNELAAAAPSA